MTEGDQDPTTRLFVDYLQRTAAGEELDFEAYCAAHLEHADELGRRKADWDRIQDVLDDLGLSGTLTARIQERYGSDVAADVSLRGEEEPALDLGTELVERLSSRGAGYGRYRLKGEVARGGQGAVLRVWDEDLRRNLAMKIMLGQAELEATGETPPVDSRTLGRFLEEAQVTGQLDHPGIVPVHELGLDAAGRVYFTMKLVKGESLQQVFAKVRSGEDGWTQTRALGVLSKVCEAMAYAHAKGVIHRDLKPANVMVGKFGEVYVMDWGLARVLGKEDGKNIRIQPVGATSEVLSERRERGDTPDSPLITMDGDVVGTPAYMSPEQAHGELESMGPWSDVYSIGAMLYELLVGHMPYVKPGMRLNNYAVWHSTQAGPPEPVMTLARGAPAELVAICERAMERERASRYSDVSALATDLAAFLEGRVVQAYETGSAAELRKWVFRNRSLSLASTAGVLALVVGLVLALGERSKALAAEEVAAKRSDRLAEANASLVRANDTLLLQRAREDGSFKWNSQQNGLAEAFLRMSERILSGEATAEDRHQFALAYLGPRVEANSLQSFGEVLFDLHFQIHAPGTNLELGAFVLPELTVDGVPFQFEKPGVFSSGCREDGRFDGRILRGTFESNRLETHTIAGSVKVFLGRSREPGHYVSSELEATSPSRHLEVLGEPITLHLSESVVTVMEDAPGVVERAVFAGPLPDSYCDGIRAYLDPDQSNAEWGAVVLEVPRPPVMFFCEIHFRVGEKEVSGVSLEVPRSEIPGHLTVHPSGSGVSVNSRRGSVAFLDGALLTFQVPWTRGDLQVVIEHDQALMEEWFDPGTRGELPPFGSVDLVVPVTEWP